MSQHSPHPYPASPPWQAGYVYAGRPGVLTAVGVTSIIVASLSLIGSGIWVLSGWVMFTASRMTTTMATSSASQYNSAVYGAAATRGPAPAAVPAPDAPPATEVAPVTTAPSVPAGAPDGLAEADRDTVVGALQELESISPQRRRHLDALLSRAGKEIFPADRPGADYRPTLTTADVTAAVTDHGTLPAETGAGQGPVYFETAAGRVELREGWALFRPARRARDAVRVSAPPEAPATAPDSGDPFANPAAPAGPAAAAATRPVALPASGALRPAEVQSVIQAIQAAAGPASSLNPAQVATLRNALSARGQQIVNRGSIASPVTMVNVQPDGSAMIQFRSTWMMLDPQGRVISQQSRMMPRIVLDPMPIAVVEGEAFASLALAVLLLVAGILLLRQSPRGRRLHQIFALTKIPLSVVAIAGFCWMMADLAKVMERANAASGGGGGGPSEGFVHFGITIAALGLIYPIVLLLVMHTGTVRAYYRSMGEG